MRGNFKNNKSRARPHPKPAGRTRRRRPRERGRPLRRGFGGRRTSGGHATCRAALPAGHRPAWRASARERVPSAAAPAGRPSPSGAKRKGLKTALSRGLRRRGRRVFGIQDPGFRRLGIGNDSSSREQAHGGGGLGGLCGEIRGKTTLKKWSQILDRMRNYFQQ